MYGTRVLRIALDASLWDEPTTGIGLHARELHRALTAKGARVERWGARKTGEQPRRGMSRTRFFLDELPKRLARERPDVFHAVSNFNLPLQKVEGVRFSLTVHDLIPVLLPDTVSTAFAWQFRLWLSRSLKVADHVVCVSARTQADLRSVFGFEGAHVVPNGVDHVDRVPPPDRITAQYLDALGLPRDFVLYAGALDARKNVEAVIDACLSLPKPTTLVLAGQQWFGSGAIEAKIARAAEQLDLRPLGYLPDSVFYGLMRRAGVFVFPSRYEGFGLPPLEAMRLGVPVIVSREGALPEVCGDGAVQANEPAEIAAEILRLRKDATARAALIARGQRRAAQFTWDAAAEALLALWR